jgi:twinkle protein
MDNLLIKGVSTAEEYADDIETLREFGLPSGESIGFPSLDNLYRIPKGQWSVVTGFSGSGKSTWLDNVFVNLAKNSGWKFLVCSPENQPIQRHIASLMEIYTGKKFGKVGEGVAAWYMTDDEYREAYAFICEHFCFINPPDTEFTVDGIIALAEHIHESQFQFDGMILDPYNEIEHKRPSGMNETDYVSVVIQKFRNMTRKLNIHFWFVAHPTKPTRLSVRVQQVDEEAKKPVYQKCTLFDIAGSANWKSKCDFGIIVHRDFGERSAPSLIEIEKVRFRENGMMGEMPLYYDRLNNRFVENYSELLYHAK